MKKKLSKFICKELLYDYITGALDSQRKEQVEAFLKEDESLREDLSSLEHAIKYTSQLKKITLSAPYNQELKEVYQKEGSTYHIKKASIKTLQGLGVAAILSLLYFYFPAEQIINYFKRDPNKIIIAEIETTTKRLGAVSPIEFGEDEPESLLTEDDAAMQVDAESEGEEQEVKLSPDQEKQLRAELEKQEVEQKLAAQAESQRPAETVTNAEPQKTKQKTNGFVYRSFMTVSNKNEVADSIVQRIESLGGQKAGSVLLGWTKPNGNRYFHFTMTESNFEILKTFLNTITSIEIVKSPHPRVIATGQIRMILEVQEP